MPSQKPIPLVAAALAAMPLSWPELHELFGQQAATLPASWIVGNSIKWVFFDFQLDQYALEAAGTCTSSFLTGFQPFMPVLGPVAGSQDWEHALRRQFLLAEAGEYPAWNRLKLVYELVPDTNEQRTAILQSSERGWNKELATLNQQRQAARQLPPAARKPAAHAAQQTWAISQRASLESALARALLPTDYLTELAQQQLYLSTQAGHCMAYFTISAGEPVQNQKPLPVDLAWVVWQYWNLRQDIAPRWDWLTLTVGPANPGAFGQCVFQFGTAAGPQVRLQLMQADGQFVPTPPPAAPATPPPSPALLNDLQTLYASLKRALKKARPDDSYAAFLRWRVKPNNPSEIAYSDDAERYYVEEADALPAVLRAKLTRFAEASAAAHAPWTWLYVLVPPVGDQPESGYFTAEQLPVPHQAVDVLAYYALLRDGLLPQLPPDWDVLTIAAGFGDGLVPYQARTQLASGEELELEVQASGRAMVALDFLYSYGLHAAGCDWQHVELTFQRSGQLTASFYHTDYETHSGVANEPEVTVEEWLPAIT